MSTNGQPLGPTAMNPSITAGMLLGYRIFVCIPVTAVQLPPSRTVPHPWLSLLKCCTQGTIPATLSNAKFLRILDLSSNNLTGALTASRPSAHHREPRLVSLPWGRVMDFSPVPIA